MEAPTEVPGHDHEQQTQDPVGELEDRVVMAKGPEQWAIEPERSPAVAGHDAVDQVLGQIVATKDHHHALGDEQMQEDRGAQRTREPPPGTGVAKLIFCFTSSKSISPTNL